MVIDWIFENCYKQRNRVLTFAISIHAPRTGSDSQAGDGARLLRRISIHAPRTGSDTPSAAGSSGLEYFNPRSPHGERRASTGSFGRVTLFQSTLPARGATVHEGAHVPRVGDFNPRSPHGERRNLRRDGSTLIAHFNPRSPHGERHKASINSRLSDLISIHAPRTGSDTNNSRWTGLQSDFNPRSPHGERRCWHILSGKFIVFQSTLPARGATGCARRYKQWLYPFQSTLPARGATPLVTLWSGAALIFQSTLPARGATTYAGMGLPS